MIDLEYGKELQDILEIYKQDSKEPLDSDEIDKLCNIIKLQLNLIEGNIDYKEYMEAL